MANAAVTVEVGSRSAQCSRCNTAKSDASLCYHCSNNSSIRTPVCTGNVCSDCRDSQLYLRQHAVFIRNAFSERRFAPPVYGLFFLGNLAVCIASAVVLGANGEHPVEDCDRLRSYLGSMAGSGGLLALLFLFYIVRVYTYVPRKHSETMDPFEPGAKMAVAALIFLWPIIHSCVAAAYVSRTSQQMCGTSLFKMALADVVITLVDILFGCCACCWVFLSSSDLPWGH